MNKITRYDDGIYLIPDECRVAYTQGKKLIIEREGHPTITFSLTLASKADSVAKRINEDIEVVRARNRAAQVIDP